LKGVKKRLGGVKAYRAHIWNSDDLCMNTVRRMAGLEANGFPLDSEGSKRSSFLKGIGAEQSRERAVARSRTKQDGGPVGFLSSSWFLTSCLLMEPQFC
jgi:hypothetical protein